MFPKTHVSAKMDNNMTLTTTPAPTQSPPAPMVNTIMEISVSVMLVSEDTMVNAVNALTNPAMNNAFARAVKSMMLKTTDVPQTVPQTQFGMETHACATQALSFTTMSVDNAPVDLLPTKTPTLVFAQTTMFSMLLTTDAMLTVHQVMFSMETLVSAHLAPFNTLTPVDNAPAEAQPTPPQTLVSAKMVIHMTLLITDATTTVAQMKFFLATPVFVLEISIDTTTHVDNAPVVQPLTTHKLHAFAQSLDKHSTSSTTDVMQCNAQSIKFTQMVDVSVPQTLFFTTMFADNAPPAQEPIKTPTLVSVLMVSLSMPLLTPVSADVKTLKLGSMDNVPVFQVTPGTTMDADNAPKAQNLLLTNKLVSALAIRLSTSPRQTSVLNVVLTLNQTLPELHVFACQVSTNLEIHVFPFNSATLMKILSITNANASMGSLELDLSVLRPVVSMNTLPIVDVCAKRDTLDCLESVDPAHQELWLTQLKQLVFALM